MTTLTIGFGLPPSQKEGSIGPVALNIVQENIRKKYGYVLESTYGADYEKIAYSYLNLFTDDVSKKIKESIWFKVIVQNRISIHTLNEELKSIKRILSDGKKYDFDYYSLPSESEKSSKK